MNQSYFPWWLSVLCVLILGLPACSPQANVSLAVEATSAALAQTAVGPATPAVAASAHQTFSDPFSYCAAVVNIDTPDERYTGAPTPPEIARGYLQAAGINADEEELLKRAVEMTIWRCMDARVYACNFGANIPCNSKANTDKNPTQSILDFCQENKNADFIPYAVIGHSSIYSWHCVNDVPEILNQENEVDAAGYQSEFWYQIRPGQ